MAIYMRFPGGKAKALTLSYDDGVEQDARLISILNRYGLKCTFNLNSGLFAAEGTVYPEGQVHRRMTRQQCLGLYAQSGHEVALHGFCHAHMEQLSGAAALRDILRDRETLESMFHTLVRGMAYPFGTYSDALVEMLAYAGVAYARTVESTEGFAIPTDWLRMPATCHHNNPRLMELAQQFLEAPDTAYPMLFYLWGHSYEFEQDDNWDVIEKFSEKVGSNPQVWYATNMEVYDYVTAYRSLVFGVDEARVYNPTCRKLYFCSAGTEYGIESGETITL